MLLQNKSNLINIIKTRNLNVICSSQLADMLSDNILSAVIVDNNSLCRKDIVKLQKGIDNLNADGVIINTSDYSKKQILQIHNECQTQGIEILYKVISINDIAKVCCTKAEILILGSDDIPANNINPYILKMLIDWDAVCFLNCSGDGISMQHILEYGFAGVYSENYINTESFDIYENIKSTNYLSKLYMKKSSIRPLLKAKNIVDSDELNICLKKDIYMAGFLFDKHNKSNIISLLKIIKDKNCIKVLEIYDKSIIDEALSLVNNGLADCIEDNTNMQIYTANTYKRYSLMNTKNTFIEPLLIEYIDIIKNKAEFHNPLWLSFQEDRNMMSIIKEYKVELIEFDIKKYNTVDKITEIIKKIKYKQ